MLKSAEEKAKTAYQASFDAAKAYDEAQQAATTARYAMDQAAYEAVTSYKTALLIATILIDAERHGS